MDHLPREASLAIVIHHQECGETIQFVLPEEQKSVSVQFFEQKSVPAEIGVSRNRCQFSFSDGNEN